MRLVNNSGAIGFFECFGLKWPQKSPNAVSFVGAGAVRKNAQL
jgi:hypothetical protein